MLTDVNMSSASDLLSGTLLPNSDKMGFHINGAILICALLFTEIASKYHAFSALWKKKSESLYRGIDTESKYARKLQCLPRPEKNSSVSIPTISVFSKQCERQ